MQSTVLCVQVKKGGKCIHEPLRNVKMYCIKVTKAAVDQ